MSGHPLLWQDLTWQEVAELRERGIRMVILPVGATEQHGPHLPLGVDTLSAEAVAHATSALAGIPVLPALAYGCSLGHSSKWPGTLSLRPETLSRIVLEIAEWLIAAGFDRLLLLNGHVTNWAPLRCGLENIRHTYPQMRVALRSLWDLSEEAHRRYHADAANFHANCAETSLMLALRPELVKLERAIDEPDRSAGCFFAYRVCDESLHGTVGSPSRARAEDGQALFDLCVGELARQLRQALTETTPLQRADLPPSFRQPE